MISQEFHTPVLLLIFNRPDTTQKVFDAIKKVKPRYLYVAGDGPRPNKPGEAEACKNARDILNQVDWDCKVTTLLRNENSGCRVAVSSAIDWFFAHVEEGIVLEDDCLPDQSFFWFCQELLEYYRYDERVMHIGGSNFQFGRKVGDASYYFSRLAHVWGWATWRRAWKLYDVKMQTLPQFLAGDKLAQIFPDKQVHKNWVNILKKIYKGANTWDYQWAYANLVHDSFCIIPNENLISNIGFGKASTHTSNEQDVLANMPTGSILKLVHPPTFEYAHEADHFTNTQVFNPPSFIKRVRNKINKIIN